MKNKNRFIVALEVRSAFRKDKSSCCGMACIGDCSQRKRL